MCTARYALQAPEYTAAMHELFRKVSHRISYTVGTPWAFAVAVFSILLWAACGWYFNYSDSWQLVINTGTTILTFLMVFLIQNTQNRDARAMHLKLDELIQAVKEARNEMIDLEDMSDAELDRLQDEFKRIRNSRGI